MSKNSVYHLIHEFSDLEEIKESFSEIILNIRKLRFKTEFNSLDKRRFFAVIDCFDAGEFFARDLKLPKDLDVINCNQYLFHKASMKVCTKILIRVDF